MKGKCHESWLILRSSPEAIDEDGGYLLRESPHQVAALILIIFYSFSKIQEITKNFYSDSRIAAIKCGLFRNSSFASIAKS